MVAKKTIKPQSVQLAYEDYERLLQIEQEFLGQKELEKPCARDPRSPVPLTLAVQNSLTL